MVRFPNQIYFSFKRQHQVVPQGFSSLNQTRGKIPQGFSRKILQVFSSFNPSLGKSLVDFSSFNWSHWKTPQGFSCFNQSHGKFLQDSNFDSLVIHV